MGMTSLFYFFTLITIISSVLVISSTNPIHSVLYLILVFCGSSGLLLLLEVDFLAMVFIMVYVGAIAVLFLFVVMMLNVRLVEFNVNMLKYLPLGGIIAFIFFLEIFLVVDKDFTRIQHSAPINNIKHTEWISSLETTTSIDSIGRLLYTNYFYLFLMAGMILLVAMIGAIVLTMYKRSQVKRQDIYTQVSRDLKQTIKFIK